MRPQTVFPGKKKFSTLGKREASNSQNRPQATSAGTENDTGCLGNPHKIPKHASLFSTSKYNAEASLHRAEEYVYGHKTIYSPAQNPPDGHNTGCRFAPPSPSSYTIHRSPSPAEGAMGIERRCRPHKSSVKHLAVCTTQQLKGKQRQGQKQALGTAVVHASSSSHTFCASDTKDPAARTRLDQYLLRKREKKKMKGTDEHNHARSSRNEVERADKEMEEKEQLLVRVNASLKEENDRLKKRAASLEGQVRALKEDKRKQAEEIGQLKESLAAQKTSISLSQQALDSQQQFTEAMIIERDAMKKKYKKKKKKCKIQSRELTESQDVKEQAREQHARLQLNLDLEIQKLKGDLSLSTKLLEDRNKAFTILHSEKLNLEGKCQTLTVERNTLEETSTYFKGRTEELSREVQAKKLANAKLQDHMSSVQDEVDGCTTALEDSKRREHDAQTLVKGAKQQLQQAEEKIRTLKLDSEHIRDQAAVGKLHLKELDKCKKQLRAERKKNATQAVKLADEVLKKKLLQDDCSRYEGQVESCHQELLQSESACLDLQHDRVVSEKDMLRQAQIIKHCKKQKKKLLKSTREAELQLDRERIKLTEEQNASETTATCQRQEIEQLQESNKSLRQKYVFTELSLNDLCEKIKSGAIEPLPSSNRATLDAYM